MSTQRFASKVDWWVRMVLAVPPIGAAFGCAMSLMHGVIAVAVFPVVFVAALYGGLLFPLYYEIGDDGLIVRFGLVRLRVAYNDIRSVRPTRNPLSSPALSLDRLAVERTNALDVNISPADKPGFLRALAEHTPQLALAGDELRPVGT